MKILVIGGGGMLGHQIVRQWRDRFDVWTTLRTVLSEYERFNIYNPEKTLENINVKDINAVEQAIQKVNPAVVINAAGIIKQLPSAKNVIQTLEINAVFPHQLAELAQKHNFRLITVSTDCVFSGRKGQYTETDISDAEDLYGKSKNLGEVAANNCLTLRTSIIGRELKTAHSLVEWFLSNRGNKVKGYTKAIYSGFPTIVMTEIIAEVIENYPHLNGLYHVSSEPIDKFNLLKLINKYYDAQIEIEPFDDFEIDRSLDSTKFRKATGFEPLDWETMVGRMVEDNEIYQKSS